MNGLAGMRAVPQWLVYALIPSKKRPGKTDKIPLHYLTGKPSGVNDPQTWTTAETAERTAAAWGVGFGAGFCFTADCGYWFIDLDSCLLPSGEWSPLAVQTCQAFAGAAVEVSSSGNGLHLFGRGTVPPHACKNTEHHAELYHADRFVAVSGSAVSGDCDTDHTAALAWFVATYFPPRVGDGMLIADDGPRADWNGPTDDAELLRRAMQSRSAGAVFGSRASFADLWHGDTDALARAFPDPERPYDASSADAALAQHLAFWTGCDAARIERLMRESALCREKYDRDDYLPRTITVARGQQTEVLADKKLERADFSAAPPGGPTMTAVTGATFLGPAETAALLEGCVYVIDAHRALIPGGLLVKPDQFRAIFGGYTFAMDSRNERTSRNAWEAFTEHQVLKCPRVDGSCFRPDLPFGAIVVDAGRKRVNTYWPVQVPRKVGDVTPFLMHLAKLLPNKRDAAIQLYFMAACVQHQGYKFQWATMLQGVEGNGKTLLSRCVAEAIGRRYVHWPKASKIAKQFNGWMVGKTFFAVEDIHTSEHVDVIEELKPMITGGDGLEIEAKGVDQISAEICGNFMFNSNHKNGLKKTRNDRRFAVLYCAQQTFDDLARDGMDGDYMNALYRWLKESDGYALVAEYLWTLAIPDEFNPAGACQRAPRTSSTDEAIEAGRGRVEQEILESIEQGLPGFSGGWISSMAVDRLIDRMGRSSSVPPNRRRDMLRELGYDWHPALPHGRTHNIVAPDGGKPRLFVLAGHTALALTAPGDIGRAYSAAQGVR